LDKVVRVASKTLLAGTEYIAIDNKDKVSRDRLGAKETN
jgi:hypothetical protein